MASPGTTVLIVADDDAVRTAVARQLEADGHHVIQASDGTAGLAHILAGRADLVILDLTLPVLGGLGGLDVLKRLRDHKALAVAGLPVIVLSGRDGDSDRIVGLGCGADDYLVKPFSPGEFAARVRSLLLRTASPRGQVVAFAPLALELDLNARSASVRGAPLTLTAKEFDLLAFFVGHPEMVFTRAQLLAQVWNSSSEWLGAATVTEHVHRLRQKVEPDPTSPRCLHTVRGVGYRLGLVP